MLYCGAQKPMIPSPLLSLSANSKLRRAVFRVCHRLGCSHTLAALRDRSRNASILHDRNAVMKIWINGTLGAIFISQSLVLNVILTFPWTIVKSYLIR